MTKSLTCIECPIGCNLSVDYEGCRVITVSGNQCPRGQEYAASEIEDPKRVLTSTVVCVGLPIKMLPVRTDQPIPKAKLFQAMDEIKKIRIHNAVSVGAVIAENFLGLGVNLVASRDCKNPHPGAREGLWCSKSPRMI